MDVDQTVHYPTEFFNSLEPSGIPLHNLVFKVSSPIIFLRNINAPRLCVESRMSHGIEATILRGFGKGEDVFIPQISIIHIDVPFEFKGRRFPVRLAFAMSINKSSRAVAEGCGN